MAAISKDTAILVVDDFSTMRKIVRNGLKNLGYENVTEACDGKEALDKLQNGNFGFVISDWNMPNMMGIDLLKAVRGDERLKGLPFLMVTAEGKKENILEAAKAGVTNYIVKPFTVDVLQQKIQAIFSK